MYYHLMFVCKLKFLDVLSPGSWFVILKFSDVLSPGSWFVRLKFSYVLSPGFPLLVLSSHLCHPLVSPTFHCKDQQNPFNESGEKSERVQLGFLGTDRHGDPGWGSWLAGVTQATQLITNSTES